MCLTVPAGCVWPPAIWKRSRENEGWEPSGKSVHQFTPHSLVSPCSPSSPWLASFSSERFAFALCRESSLLSEERSVPRDVLPHEPSLHSAPLCSLPSSLSPCHMPLGTGLGRVQNLSALPAIKPGLPPLLPFFLLLSPSSPSFFPFSLSHSLFPLTPPHSCSSPFSTERSMLFL